MMLKLIKFFQAPSYLYFIIRDSAPALSLIKHKGREKRGEWDGKGGEERGGRKSDMSGREKGERKRKRGKGGGK